MKPMIQTICQVGIVIFAIFIAIFQFGSFYFGKKEAAEKDRIATQNADAKDRAAKEREAKLEAQIAAFRAAYERNTELIYSALKITPDTWTDIELKNVPPGVADYVLLLFKADRGRISGKVRIKGSSHVSYFSTTANNTVPVAVPNVWLPLQGYYQVPTILEFSISEKTDQAASLNIYTQGWIDSRGTEPH